ncbi:MAG: acyl-CoA dehydrogenase [Gammaproteobacteria bacterium]
MVSILWLLLFVGGILALAYKRVGLPTATLVIGAALVAYTALGDGHALWLLLLWAAFGLLAALNMGELRRARVTGPMFKMYRKMLPSMSDTEREALEAGTVWWEGELFSGNPQWERLLDYPAPRLSEEEQAFLDGPVEELCEMLDEWEISHELADLPPEVWEFIKTKGFFGMIIPKSYGGLEFSAYANSQVLVKIASRSQTTSSIVAVPNSLGPAELLLKYGTEEQKDRYLNNLAVGKDIPCFALTAPRAGSDAASIPDTGVVCKGEFEGEEIIGLRLNFNKRYITLAPVATVVGLAFKLYDPDGLLGDADKKDYGITAALIPSDSPGLEIGRRHLPLMVPFQNGPLEGKDVFVPLDSIIGGPEMAGQGWKMLVECLSVGRSISLPANSLGGAKAGAWATGAYARIRKQFNTAIGNFEGIQEALARIVGFTYITDAGRSVTTAAIDAGEKPAVPSAILKYHSTEMGRVIGNDAMDIHGGKGICMGPSNYLGVGYNAIPVGITVEGANILTRSLIIFGQGAVRCHPFVLRELNAAREPDEVRALNDFDQALIGHIGYAVSNAARSLVMASTLARYVGVPAHGPTKRFYQHISRFSASFALAADVAMLTLGGALKKKEMLSARLGDILSTLYLASAVLKHYENQGHHASDLPIVEWACRSLLYKAQEQLHGFLRNFPNRWIAGALRLLMFPRGRTYYAPSDILSRRVVELIINPTKSRDRLCEGIYCAVQPNSPMGLLQEAMEMVIAARPIEQKVRKGVKEGLVTAPDFATQMEQATGAGVITEEEADTLRNVDAKVMNLINVDDFAPDELARRKDDAPPETVTTETVAAIVEKETVSKKEPDNNEKMDKEIAAGA